MQDSPPAAGGISDIILLRRSAIPPEGIFYFIINSEEFIMHEKSTVHIWGDAINFYKPNNCFFFVSNSSWVIAPISNNSSYFFNASALSTAEEVSVFALSLTSFSTYLCST